MNTQKTLLSIVVAFLLSNVLTTLWYLLTDEANSVAYRRDEINYLALMLNHLVYVGLMVHFFPAYYSNVPTLKRGFVFGCLMALLMFLPQAMVIRSIWEVDFNVIFLANTGAHVLIGGIIGIALAFIFNFKKQDLTA